MSLNFEPSYRKAFLVFVFSGMICLCTEGTALMDSIPVKMPKHQIGIGMNRLVKYVFPSDQNAFLLEYRYNFFRDCHLRSAVNFDINTQENGVFQWGIKTGLDFQIAKYDNWFFYSGTDVFYDFSHFENINRDFFSYGLIALLGIQCRIGKNFSICLEPSVFIRSNVIIDYSTFNRSNKSQWYQTGLGKIGYLQLNFHL
jgi:hypothetical protein